MHDLSLPTRAIDPRAHHVPDRGPARECPGCEIWLLAELERLRRAPGNPLNDGDGPDGWYGPILAEPIPDGSPAPDGRRPAPDPGRFSPETSALMARGLAAMDEAVTIRASTRVAIWAATRSRVEAQRLQEC